MTRVESPPEFREENDYLISMWRKLGHPDMGDVIEQYASDAYKEWTKKVIEVFNGDEENHTI